MPSPCKSYSFSASLPSPPPPLSGLCIFPEFYLQLSALSSHNPLLAVHKQRHHPFRDWARPEGPPWLLLLPHPYIHSQIHSSFHFPPSTRPRACPCCHRFCPTQLQCLHTVSCFHSCPPPGYSPHRTEDDLLNMQSLSCLYVTFRRRAKIFHTDSRDLHGLSWPTSLGPCKATLSQLRYLSQTHLLLCSSCSHLRTTAFLPPLSYLCSFPPKEVTLSSYGLNSPMFFSPSWHWSL